MNTVLVPVSNILNSLIMLVISTGALFIFCCPTIMPIGKNCHMPSQTQAPML